MKVITGEMFNTSMGKIVIHNEQNEEFHAGQIVVYEGEKHLIKSVIPNSKPSGKWFSLLIE